MLFNSLEFLIFFPVVTALYFMLPHGYRWAMLLAASCIFYMAFIPVYIFILLITILIDYFAGIWIEDSEGSIRKWLLIGSILSTCLVLFVFKYFNFFNMNFAALAHLLHWNYPVKALGIILPIGLSFHTFQSLSYVIEVYRGHQKAERHFGIYALYVMFYPQLVAGPIERPQNLLHQFREEHEFDYQRVTDGLKLMAWGLFKKVMIADRLALFVNQAYDHPHHYAGISLITATVFFAFQIYCDFSGYSDVAIGAAQVMGFKLMKNFNRPYFAKSVSEFWKRWHISLSTWFKDYLYVSLGGSRVSVPRWYLNLFITFLVSGFWHGASWTFVIWGALNGFYLIFSLVTQHARKKFIRQIGLDRFPKLHEFLQVMTTFTLICFAWIFFRASSIQDALYIVTHLFSPVRNLGPGKLTAVLLGQTKQDFYIALASIGVLITMDLLQRRRAVREVFAAQPVWFRWPVYYALLLVTLSFGVFAKTQFIYFQF